MARRSLKMNTQQIRGLILRNANCESERMCQKYTAKQSGKNYLTSISKYNCELPVMKMVATGTPKAEAVRIRVIPVAPNANIAKGQTLGALVERYRVAKK
jgi:hypothetical protein